MDNRSVILVDAQDVSIGVMDKLQAHQEGCLHRAFSICVLRSGQDGLEVLLQQRQVDKYHSGGLWTNACCSHPQPGEELAKAAQCRLAYEMGLDLECHRCGCFTYRTELSNGLIEHELDHVFVAYTDADHPSFNREEVQKVCWVGIDALYADLKERPQAYTSWLSQVVNLAVAFQGQPN